MSPSTPLRPHTRHHPRLSPKRALLLAALVLPPATPALAQFTGSADFYFFGNTAYNEFNQPVFAGYTSTGADIHLSFNNALPYTKVVDVNPTLAGNGAVLNWFDLNTWSNPFWYLAYGSFINAHLSGNTTGPFDWTSEPLTPSLSEWFGGTGPSSGNKFLPAYYIHSTAGHVSTNTYTNANINFVPSIPANTTVGIDYGRSVAIAGLINSGTLLVCTPGTNRNSYDNNSDVSLTASVIRQTVTFSGGGTLRLCDYGCARVFANSSVLNLDNTICGTGSITLDASRRFYNQGLVSSDQFRQPLNIIADSSSQAALVNSGTLESKNGGILVLGGQIIDAGGNIQALDNSTIVLTGSLSGPVSLKTVGSGLIYCRGATLTDFTNTIPGVTLFIPYQYRLNLSGTFTNTGVVIVAGTSNWRYYSNDAHLSVTSNTPNQTVTFAGAGKVVLRDKDDAYLDINLDNNSTTLLNLNNTISGSGGIVLHNSSHFLNQGLIFADDGTQMLSIVSDGSPDTTLVNSGTLQAINRGILVLGTQIIDNGGSIEALDNSFIWLTGSISGPIPLKTVGSGQIYSKGATLSDFTNTIPGVTISIPYTSRLTLSGTFTNTGSVSVSGLGGGSWLGNDSHLVISSSSSNQTVTLTGSGNITLAERDNAYVDINPNNNSTSLLNLNNTISGTGTIKLYNSARFYNRSLISANIGTQSLSIVTDNTPNTAFVNSGTLQAANGGTLALATQIIDAGGTIRALDNSTIRFTTSSSVSATTTLFLAPTARLDLANSPFIVRSTPLPTLRSYLASGQLTSSAASWNKSLALFSNALDPNTPYFTSLAGIPLLPSDSLLLLTYTGDANLDGLLDGQDYKLLSEALAFNLYLPQYDLDHDGQLDQTDFDLFYNNYTNALTNPTAFPPLALGLSLNDPANTSIPEPASLSLLALLSPLLARRTRRTFNAPATKP